MKHRIMIVTMYIIGIEINIIAGAIIYIIIYVVYFLLNKKDFYRFIKLSLNNKINLEKERK